MAELQDAWLVDEVAMHGRFAHVQGVRDLGQRVMSLQFGVWRLLCFFHKTIPISFKNQGREGSK